MAAAMAAIAPWAMDSTEVDLPEDGETTFERSGLSNPGLRTVRVQRVQDPVGLMIDVEDDDGSGAVWGVNVRLAFPEGRLLAWVDNTWESDTVIAPVGIGRPRVVDALLALCDSPKLGSSRILTEPVSISPEEIVVLHEVLVDPHRGLPVVVVTCPWSGFDDHARRRADTAAKRLTGLATVVLLDSAGQDALKEVLPDRLGVWGGAVRVYAPGSLDSPAAHRIYSGDLVRQRGIEPVVNWVTSMSSRRRPDQQLRLVHEALAKRKSTATTADLEGLTLELELAHQELESEILERAEVEAELNKALVLVRRLRQLGFEAGRGQDIAQAEQEVERTDETFLTVSDAVARARAVSQTT